MSGTCIQVAQVLDLVAAGKSFGEITDYFPGLIEDDIRACLEFARDLVQSEAARQHTAPVAKGFPVQHWKRLKKFPKLKGDSGRFIARDRGRG